MRLGRLSVTGTVGALLAALACMPASAGAASVRVPADYFGINFQGIDSLDDAGRDQQLGEIERLGIEVIRSGFSWQVIEPTRGTYVWDHYDAIVGDSARHGITVEPTIVQTPAWNTPNDILTELYCQGGQSQRPLSIAPFGDVSRAIANRYGRGGSFWQQHPALQPHPITEYEIWNEENLNGGWCPAPDPTAYASMFVLAARQIHAVDPVAEVSIGGVAERVPRIGEGQDVDTFLGRVIAAEPAVRTEADAVAIHIYPQATPGGQTYKLQTFRKFLQRGGIPNETPMIVNEIGWPSKGVAWALDQGQRAKGYTAITETIPRTNCNVSAVSPHTWITPEANDGDPEDWFGIADPSSGAPYEPARAYGHGISVQRGELATEADRKTIKACDGMPTPDRDREGVPDEDDYFPLDPGHAARRAPKHRLPAVECSVRMTAAWDGIKRSEGDRRRRYRKAYRRLTAHCLPCPAKAARRLRRLEHKILRSPHEQRIKRRAKHVAGVRRCRMRASG